MHEVIVLPCGCIQEGFSLTRCPEHLAKPSKSGRLERKDRSKARKLSEDDIKDAVRDREKASAWARQWRVCRYPDCPMCRSYKGLLLEVAHVLQAKGMGGDPKLTRSRQKDMMVLDVETHRRQEGHDIDIVPIVEDLGTDGPCEFWKKGEDGQMYLVAREIVPGGPYERD